MATRPRVAPPRQRATCFSVRRPPARSHATSCADRQRVAVRAARCRQRTVIAEIGRWIDKHTQFERRLRWLLNPEVTRAELNSLDPMTDADQLFAFVKYEFRFEFLFCAWANAIERISQSESVSTFFHGTGAGAKTIRLKRTEDTLIHIYYFMNWGADSYHGRLATASMNQMHGRYFIHNDGMKYVLLNGAISVLDP